MDALQKLVDHAVATALKKFAPLSLRAEQLGVTLVDLDAEKNFPHAAHRGDAPFYPASVIKAFYLVAANRWLEDGKISDSPELRRGLRDMIVDSGNEATGYVLDVLTDTTSGPELPPVELAAWHEKRNVVNRYFHQRGYPEINANRKTWNEGPYGRDKQAVDQFTPSRNCLTTNATARLFVEIALDKCISAARSAEMRALLYRNFTDPQSTDYQAREFTGAGLPPTAKLWSKAGDMSTARHDAAIVELASGKKFVLVIFTTRPEEKGIIPAIAREIVSFWS
ncbi:MAG TPA: serine hydrolase [Verrucomicrobiae bacterium]|nr:serine hydrolase [Verrucomicrobiae bacterium]